MFEIPSKVHALDQRPAFELTKPRLATSRRERHLEETVPAPPGIRTRFLNPYDLVVHWTRDLATNTFSYEIEIEGR